MAGAVKAQKGPPRAARPVGQGNGFRSGHVGPQSVQKHNARPVALDPVIGDAAALGRCQKAGVCHSGSIVLLSIACPPGMDHPPPKPG